MTKIKIKNKGSQEKIIKKSKGRKEERIKKGQKGRRN